MLGYVRRDSLVPRAEPRPLQDPVPIVDPTGEAPLIWIIPVPESKSVNNRMRIDVYGDTQSIVALGARLVRPRGGDIEWDVLADLKATSSASSRNAKATAYGCSMTAVTRLQSSTLAGTVRTMGRSGVFEQAE